MLILFRLLWLMFLFHLGLFTYLFESHPHQGSFGPDDIIFAGALFAISFYLPKKAFAYHASKINPEEEVPFQALFGPYIVQLLTNLVILVGGLKSADPFLFYILLSAALAHHFYRFPSSMSRLLSFYGEHKLR